MGPRETIGGLHTEVPPPSDIAFSPGGWALPLADTDAWLRDEEHVSPHWLYHRLTGDFQQRRLAFSQVPVPESRPVLLVSSRDIEVSAGTCPGCDRG